ncbi:unnamed protein product [Urochloa decumbens]|uniref:Uncharacterized protein n=1 Tax=Urochloa decumbens TaxID=240449 RepID=A0ABC9E5K7_9POAL
MADLVFGLAKTAVSGTVAIAKSAIEEDKKLKKSVQRDLLLISDEFEMMHSFLNVANERVGDDMTRTCVRQVRDMALDVEDSIESIVFLDNKPGWWRRMLPSCMPGTAQVAALDNAVATVELLKTRVEAMGQRNTRYSQISGSGSGSASAAGSKSKQPPAELDEPQQTHAGPVPNATALDILSAAKEDARQRGPLDLVKLINREVGILQVISVWRTGGGDEGMKSITSKAFHHSEICKNFKCRAWVKLMHPFNVNDFIRSMLIQFNVNNYLHQGCNADVLKPNELMKATEGELSEAGERSKAHLPEVSQLKEFGHDSVCVFFKEDISAIREAYRILHYPYLTAGNHNREVISLMGIASFDDAALRDVIIRLQHTSEKSIRWLNVSHPFDFSNPTQSMLWHNKPNDDLGLQHRFSKDIYVITGLRSTEDWDAINEACSGIQKPGACIMVITNDEGIAAQCATPNEAVYNLKDIEVYNALPLFVKKETAKKAAAINWARETHLSQIDPLTLTDFVYKSNVLSVWGIPGVGKSSIVKLIYYQQMCFWGGFGFIGNFNKFGWVNVSHPFDLKELSQSLLLDLHSESLQHGGMLRIKDPIQMCHEFLQENSCLVVIDGLRSKEEWDLMSAAFSGYNETVIIVITNEESVAAYCAKPERAVFNVKGLDDYGACDLFVTEVIKKKMVELGLVVMDRSAATDLQDQNQWLNHFNLGRSIEYVTGELKRNEQAVKLLVHKCGGLPKVIVELAPVVAMRLEDPELWMCLNNNFMQVLEHDRWFPGLQGLFEWVNSYFRSCPDFLKPCIFYLSIFPVSHSIRRRRLVRRWVAEGYARDTKENNAEDTAEDFIFKLVKLSIIKQHINLSPEEAYYTRVPLLAPFLTSSCKANGLFLEYIISRPMEENLVFALQGSCSLNSQHSGRHLTIRRSWDRDESVFEGVDFSKLRSLTVFGEWKPFFVSKEMRLLRVLDLEDASSGVTNGEVEKIVHLLPGLKFLSLRGLDEITRLPDSLGKLRQLQTLDIRGTSVITLPKSIVKLRKLQYIRAGANPAPDDDIRAAAASPSPLITTSISKPAGAKSMLKWLSGFCVCGRIACSHNGGVEVPSGIGEMTALLTFGVIDLSVPMVQDILKELKKLAQLRKLGACGINKSNVQKFLDAISGHGHLQSLSVRLDKDYQDDCLKDISEPPKNIQTFKLVGLARELPVWIINLQSLTKLKLQMAKLPQEQIDIIGKLPLLRLLCLCFKEFEDSKLNLRNGFYKLRLLEITCNSGFKDVVLPPFGVGAIYLEVLKIRCCDAVVSPVQFHGLNRNTLKEIWITGTYDQAFKQHIQNQIYQYGNAAGCVLREEDWILGSSGCFYC